MMHAAEFSNDVMEVGVPFSSLHGIHWQVVSCCFSQVFTSTILAFNKAHSLGFPVKRMHKGHCGVN